MYPTFSIKAGCAFDYSDYPDDYNECTVSVYAPEACDKVHLKVYGGYIPPTVMLGEESTAGRERDPSFRLGRPVEQEHRLGLRGSQCHEQRRLLQGGQRLGLRAADGRRRRHHLVTGRGSDQLELFRSMLRLKVSFRRHSALFGVNIALPIFV